MEVKVSWSPEVKPLFHISYGEQRILFLQASLIRKEAVALLHFLFDRPHDLAPSVFKVRFVDLNALFESAAFFTSPFPGVPLSELPAYQFLLLEGF